MISGLKAVAADDIRSDSLSKALRGHAVTPLGLEIHLAH